MLIRCGERKTRLRPDRGGNGGSALYRPCLDRSSRSRHIAKEHTLSHSLDRLQTAAVRIVSMVEIGCYRSDLTVAHSAGAAIEIQHGRLPCFSHGQKSLCKQSAQPTLALGVYLRGTLVRKFWRACMHQSLKLSDIFVCTPSMNGVKRS